MTWSPIPKLLTHSSNSVTELTDRKITWIIREKMKEILSTKDIALLQNVRASRIRQISWRYRITKTVPILAKPGRPSRSITNEEISAVIGIYREYPCSTVVLETPWKPDSLLLNFLPRVFCFRLRRCLISPKMIMALVLIAWFTISLLMLCIMSFVILFSWLPIFLIVSIAFFIPSFLSNQN